MVFRLLFEQEAEKAAAAKAAKMAGKAADKPAAPAGAASGNAAPSSDATGRDIAVGVGITAEALTGNLSGVNFTSGRMGRLDMDANVEGRRWLCDLGFGSYGIRAPMDLDAVGVEVAQDCDTFQLTLDERGEYVLKARVEGEWTNQYAFDLSPQLPCHPCFCSRACGS